MRGAKDGVRLKIRPAMMKCSVARKWRWSKSWPLHLKNAARGQHSSSIPMSQTISCRDMLKPVKKRRKHTRAASKHPGKSQASRFSL